MSANQDLAAAREAIEAAQAGCERDGVNYTYIATTDGGNAEMVLAANRCGLLRLAGLLLELADRPGEPLPSGPSLRA